MEYQTCTDCGISVFYTPELDGGGRLMWRNYMAVIRTLFGKVDRLHEWCAGPGFIGFAALENGLCETLCLSDINPSAVAALRETVQRNGLEGRVTVYEADMFKGIPQTERWDLVVGNPPHYRVETEDEYRANLLGNDPSWRLHREFYRSVSAFLKPKASTLLIESYDGSTEADFVPLVQDSPLTYVGSFTHRLADLRDSATIGGIDRFYYVWASMGSPTARLPETIRRSDATLAAAVPINLSTSIQHTLDLTADRAYRFFLANSGPVPLHVGLLTANGRFAWPFPRPITISPAGQHLSTVVAMREGIYRLGHVEAPLHTRESLWDYRGPLEHDLLATVRVRRA